MPARATGENNIQQEQQAAAVRTAAGVELNRGGRKLKHEEVVKTAERAKTRSAKEALQTISSRFTRLHYKETAAQTIQFGFNDEGKRISKEGTNQEEATKTAIAQTERYIQLMQHGYDGLKDIKGGETKAQMQANLRSQMEAAILKNPMIAEQLGVKDSAGKITLDAAVIEDALRNPSTLALLAEKLNDAYDPDKFPTELEGKIAEADTKYKDKKAEYDLMSPREEDLKEQHKINQKAFEDFNKPDSTGISPRARLNQLESSSEVLAYKSARDRVRQLEGARDSGNRKLYDEAVRHRDELARHGNVIDYQGLDAQRASVELALDNTSRGLSTIAHAQNEMAAARRALDVLEAQRGQYAEQLSQSVGGALEDAFFEQIKRGTAEFYNNLDEDSREVISEINQGKRETLNKILARRYISENILGKEKLDKSIIKADIQVMTQGGPEEVVRRALAHPGETILTVEEKAKVAGMLKDANFMKSMGQETALRVLTNYVNAGGSLSRNESNVIEATQWGQDALARLRQGLDSGRIGEGVVNDLAQKTGETPESIKKKIAKKGLLGMILALTMGAALGATGINELITEAAQ